VKAADLDADTLLIGGWRVHYFCKARVRR
jgi:hypothetical protein